MKKSLFTFSALALFAGAVMAEDSIKNYESTETKGSIFAADSNIDGSSSIIISNSTVYSTVVSDSEIWTLAGGGAEGVSVGGNTSVILKGIAAKDTSNGSWAGVIYGAGMQDSSVGGNSSVEILSGSVINGLNNWQGAIFGGGALGSVVNGNSSVKISGSGTSISGTDIYGGSCGVIAAKINGKFSYKVDSSRKGIVNGDSTVSITDGAKISNSFISSLGYANTATKGNAYVNVENATVDGGAIFNGGRSTVGDGVGGAMYPTVYGIAETNVKNSEVSRIGSIGKIGYGNANFDESGNFVSVKDSSKVVSRVVVNNSTTNGTIQTIGYDNTGNPAIAYGNVEMRIENSSKINANISMVGIGATVYGNSTLTVENSEINAKIYGGATRGGKIYGDVNISLKNSSVSEDIITSGLSKGTQTEAVVCGNVNITLDSSSVGGTIYAGGRGENTTIEGNASITMKGRGSDAGYNIVGIGQDGGIVKGKSTLIFDSFNSGDGAKLSASSFHKVDVNSSLVNFTEALNCETLSVSEDSKVLLVDGSAFDKLSIAFQEDFSQGKTGSVDLETIFGSSTSIVLSSLQEEAGASFTVKDSSGQEWSVASKDFADNTLSFVVGSQVPEPSTYAAIFGALALGFAVYRRRK